MSEEDRIDPEEVSAILERWGENEDLFKTTTADLFRVMFGEIKRLQERIDTLEAAQKK